MDPSILVAISSVAIALVTTAGGLGVAALTGRREAENAADAVLDEVTAQRLALKDEQIAALEQKVRNRDDKITRQEATIERLQARLATRKGP